MGDDPDTSSIDKLNSLLADQVTREEHAKDVKMKELGREELQAIKAQTGGSFSAKAPEQGDYL